jgi:hypothetical protein
MCFCEHDFIEILGETINNEDEQSNFDVGFFDRVPVTYNVYDFLMAKLGIFAWPDVQTVEQLKGIRRNRWVILMYLLDNINGHEEIKSDITRSIFDKYKNIVLSAFIGKENRKKVKEYLNKLREEVSLEKCLVFLSDKNLPSDSIQHTGALVRLKKLNTLLHHCERTLRNKDAIVIKSVEIYTAVLSFVFVLYILAVVFGI